MDHAEDLAALVATNFNTINLCDEIGEDVDTLREMLRELRDRALVCEQRGAEKLNGRWSQDEHWEILFWHLVLASRNAARLGAAAEIEDRRATYAHRPDSHLTALARVARNVERQFAAVAAWFAFHAFAGTWGLPTEPPKALLPDQSPAGLRRVLKMSMQKGEPPNES